VTCYKDKYFHMNRSFNATITDRLQMNVCVPMLSRYLCLFVPSFINL
jgi:hypothetical protein